MPVYVFIFPAFAIILHRFLRFSGDFSAKPAAKIQERKSSPNIKFLGGISCGRLGGRPSPKTFPPSLGAQENKVFCADVLDPKARTSITRGGLGRILCRKISG